MPAKWPVAGGKLMNRYGSPPTPELVVDCRCDLGAAPVWSDVDGHLYWTDALGETVFAFDPVLHNLEILSVDQGVSAITIQQDGTRLLFMVDGRIDAWNGDRMWTVHDWLPELAHTRFTGVCCAPDGCLLCGVAEVGQSANIYRVTPEGVPSLILDNCGLATGMGFAPEANRVYVTDSNEGMITRFDYNGDLRGSFLLAMELGDDLLPSGLAVDLEGCVWSAVEGGGYVRRYTPDGEEDRRVRLPCHQVTGVSFGGPLMRDLYITTGRANGDARRAGGLFRLRTPVPGLPDFPSQLCV